jgi:hypothetical protein
VNTAHYPLCSQHSNVSPERVVGRRGSKQIRELRGARHLAGTEARSAYVKVTENARECAGASSAAHVTPRPGLPRLYFRS